ncbi:hypothetical protein E4S40_13080 [Algoriphagus kandeliae]|uniref:Uncharacterized protein n=2 Tax=Algoriphagus kandeliae TaxID=2562278 RepID=A0A4Y9QPB3_9BACT|nr:hypothetical protein E4S40_13080 [Algoriphagus kandeliae]
MTEDEFDLLDELYFVQPYDYLQETLNWSEDRLLDTLDSLYRKAFIKCLSAPDDELFGAINILENGKEMLFLATKKGLMAHNAL